MENINLSWWDKNIIPRTNEYKDFIRDNFRELYLSPEEFYEDGERNDISEEYSTKERKFLAIYEFRRTIKNTISLESHPYTIGVLIDNEFKDKYTSCSPLGAVDVLMNYKDETLRVVNNLESTSFTIQNKSEAFKAISDFWGRELTKQSDLSKGLNYTKIDENHSYYFNRHLLEENKLNLTQNVEFSIITLPKAVFNEYLYRNNNMLEANVKVGEYLLAKDYHGVKLSTELRDNLYKDLDSFVEVILNDNNISKEIFFEQLTAFEIKEGLNGSYSEIRDRLYQDIDLFEHYQFIPEDIKPIYNNLIDKESTDGLDYNDCNQYQLELEKKGYTFDYGLDSQPIYLRSTDPVEQYLLKEKIFQHKSEPGITLNLNEHLSPVPTDIIGGKIIDIAEETVKNPEYLKQYDTNTQNTVNAYIASLAEQETEYYILDIDSLIDKDLEDQLLLVPDFIEGREISIWQKSELISGNKISTADPEYEDEINLSFSLNDDGKLSAYYHPTGEEYFLTSDQVRFVNKDNNSQIHTNNEIKQDNYFVINNLNITPQQTSDYAKNEEFGKSLDYPITDEQLQSIPDIIDGHVLSKYDKSLLATGSLDFKDNGESYVLENSKILKTTLDVNYNPISSYLTNKQVYFNNQNSRIMENSENNQKKAINQLEVGKIASVNNGSGFFKGKIENISGDSITIKNLKGEQKEFNKKEVYQFFPGQKYDKYEIETLFKNKPGGIGFADVEKNDLTKLMRGELTNTVYHGSKTQETGEEKNYSFKLRALYSSEDKKVKITPEWKNNKEIDWDNLQKFGKQISPEQVEKLQSGKSIVLDIDVKIQNKPDYSVKLHFDKDLNSIVFDGFVNGKRPEQSDNLQMQKEPLKKDFKDRFAYEEWLTNDVNIFDNATKVNLHQLNKMFLVIDETELNEFLTDFSIESKKIDVVLSSPDIIKGDDRIENLKSEILSDINSSSEKVDLFKEKFKSLDSGNINNNTLKR